MPSRSHEREPGGTIKPQGQWHHGDLRSSLIAWGLHLVDTEGAAGMSMRAAARLAGVSPAAPAHHFEDRNALLAAIAAHVYREFGEASRRRLARLDPGDLEGRLRASMRGYVNFARRYPARLQLMFGSEIRNRERYPELMQASATSFQTLHDALAPCLADTRLGGMQPDELVRAIWVAIHGAAVLSQREGGADAAASGESDLAASGNAQTNGSADTMLRFLLAALGVSAGGPA